MSSVVEPWAQWAAAQGWHVFPADHPGLPKCAGIGRGHNPDEAGHQRGKHPAVSFTKAATTDQRQIAAWFDSDGPSRNYGIYCGPSRLLVVDEDRPAALTDWAAQRGVEIPETFSVATREGRRHLYFTVPEAFVHHTGRGALEGTGVDIRAGNGYVIGPGSLHATGTYYTPTDATIPAAGAPDWLLEAVKAAPARNDNDGNAAQGVTEGQMGAFWAQATRYAWPAPEEVAPGEQNTDLHTAAWSAAARRYDDATALEMLYARIAGYEPGDPAHPWTEAHADAMWERVKREYADKRATEAAELAEQGQQLFDASGLPIAAPVVSDDEMRRRLNSGPGLFTDTRLADLVSYEVLVGYCWSKEFGWAQWDGKRWDLSTSDETIAEHVRTYVRTRFYEAVMAGSDDAVTAGWQKCLSSARQSAVVRMCKGIRERRDAFDAHPDLLNCTNGVVDLRTGELTPHRPDLLLTKITGVDYKPEAVHDDWKAALQALPEEVRGWYQTRCGQGVTGHMTPDDVLVVQQGGGENGKTTLAAGLQGALGDYYTHVSHRAVLGDATQHPTELMAFRGARFALLEETPEERRLSVVRLKQLVGTPTMKARYIRRDEVEWQASHSLFLSTNYLPSVEETDHGTWRRLACLRFPYTFRKPGEALRHERDRPGDPTLRERIKLGQHGQHEAVLTWLVAGARNWYQADKIMPTVPDLVVSDTREWRADSDVIMGYLDDRLEFAPGRHVIATELLEDFNRWMMARQHKPWSEKTFKARFLGHSEVSGRHIEHVRFTNAEGLSRPPEIVPVQNVGSRYTGWWGLKFQDPVSNGINPTPPLTWENAGLPGKPGIPEKQPDFENRPIQKSVVSLAEHTDGTSDDHDNSGAGKTSDSPVTEAEAKKLAKAAEREAKRRARIAETQGDVLELPAVVTRVGEVGIVSVPEAVELLRGIPEAWTVDVEHSGYPIGHRDYWLKTVQLGDESCAVIFDATDDAQRNAVRQLFAFAAANRIRLHAHSAQADLVPMAMAGLGDWERMWDAMYDTVIPAKLGDPKSTGSDPALKQLADAVLGADAVSSSADRKRSALFKAGAWVTEVKPDTPVEKSGWAQVDSRSRTMIVYGGSDVLDDAAIARRVRWPDAGLLDRERTAQRMTANISRHGIAIDREHVAQMLQMHRPLRDEAGTAVKAYGIPNPGSDRQIATYLTEHAVQLPHTEPSKTYPNGQASVAKDILLKVKRDYGGDIREFVDTVLTYRLHSQRVGTFLENYLALCDYGDARARPTVYTLGADTGRMSCVRPNLQQVPREGGFRACFTADPGTLLIGADLSGVEIRVAAALSRDTALIQMLLDGADVHALIARQVYGPDATKAHRYKVKRGVFGWLYGGGVDTLSAQIEADIPTTQAMIDTLKAYAPQLTGWKQQVMSAVTAGRTQWQSYSGRVIYLDRDRPHAAPNYLVQGTARELLIDALLRWRQTPWGNRVLLPVHDEIDVVVPEAEAEEATAQLVRCMTTQLEGVPIVADPAAPSWAWQDSS